MHKKKITLKSNEENYFELINNTDSFTLSQRLSGLVTTAILLCYCLYLCTKLHTTIQNSTHPVVGALLILLLLIIIFLLTVMKTQND